MLIQVIEQLMEQKYTLLSIRRDQPYTPPPCTHYNPEPCTLSPQDPGISVPEAPTK
jgi:hypothetical protein